MRITMIAYGTRGDVQPTVALGQALQQRGHDVTILAGRNFSDWITSHGLKIAPTDVDIQTMMESAGGLEWIDRGTEPLVQIRVMKRLLQRVGPRMVSDAWEACQGADVIASGFTSFIYAAPIAKKLNALHITLPLQPALLATRDGSVVINAPVPNRVSFLNYIAGLTIIEPMLWSWYSDYTYQLCREVLGISWGYNDYQRSLQRTPTIMGYSNHVVPHPSDWPPNYVATGYWFLNDDEAWQPPADLLRFLNAGPPPIAIGFGSMTQRDPHATTELIVEAVQRAHQRAVLLSGWSGIGQMHASEHIFPIASAPHRWLFDRVSAVVHHGGAGTTAAGLRAGRPTVIVPHLGDQPFWGERVAVLGVGPRPIPRPKLTVANLNEAIRRATNDPSIRRNAHDLGAHIRAEDGVGRAVEVIERVIQRGD